MKRRQFIYVSVGATLAPIAGCGRPWSSGGSAGSEQFARIERSVQGRLGVAAFDSAKGSRLQYRAQERFPLCSTFKWLLASQLLYRVDRGVERLDRPIHYGAADLLDYAPITRSHVSVGSMSVAGLCAAAVTASDNTAANLLLAEIGGPARFTSYLRHIGDAVSRLDRIEPELNSATPGDPRDTTTPDAMLRDMQHVLLGNYLSRESRDRLLGWLIASTTGRAKIRAGLPPAWRVGDKTGMGANGTTNDVAIIWPTDRAPLLVTVYLTESTASVDARNGALSEVARCVAARWA